MLDKKILGIDKKGLQQFGLILGGLLLFGFGLVLPWFNDWDNVPNLQWMGVGTIVIVWALTAPSSIRVFYVWWMRVALVIGSVINFIILGFVFYFVITFMGIVMRFTGRDPMRRSLDKNIKSYRIKSIIRSKNHVERPF